MKDTIGKIIRRLRKEKKLTQEKLAELLNVTPQAVSKWENDTGIPDVSQIIPLSNIFEVSTDIILGKESFETEEEVIEMINTVDELIYKEKRYEAYLYIQEQLKKHPSNLKLLQKSIELCCQLGYYENDCYDYEHANEIYKTAHKQEKIIINLSSSITDILRARYIMMLLHISNMNYKLAEEEAKMFPFRNDMTIHNMYSYIHHSLKNYEYQAYNSKVDLSYHLESSIDNIVSIANAYEMLNDNQKALLFYKKALEYIKFFFKEEILPPLHIRYGKDIYLCIAKIYIKLNQNEKALKYLSMMVDYDVNVRNNYTEDKRPNSIFFNNINETFYYKQTNTKKKLLEKLNDKGLLALKDNDNFKKLLKVVNGELFESLKEIKTLFNEVEK